MKIIYPFNNGVAVIISTGKLPIEEVAKKDVPEGLPFLFVDDLDIPEDRYFRDAWEADFSNPDGYGLGYEKWNKQKELQK